MKTYQITIFNQSRILLCLIVFCMFAPSSIILAFEIGIIATVAIAMLLSFCFYFFSIRKLTVTINNDMLSFTFKGKPLFASEKTESVLFSDIQHIVIDDGKFLRKIYTSKKVIRLNTSRIHIQDTVQLLNDLKTKAPAYNIEITNSWGEWKKRNLLKKVYYINNIVLAVALAAFIIHTMTNGFTGKALLLLSPGITQLILYGNIIKQHSK